MHRRFNSQLLMIRRLKFAVPACILLMIAPFANGNQETARITKSSTISAHFRALTVATQKEHLARLKEISNARVARLRELSSENSARVQALTDAHQAGHRSLRGSELTADDRTARAAEVDEQRRLGDLERTRWWNAMQRETSDDAEIQRAAALAARTALVDQLNARQQLYLDMLGAGIVIRALPGLDGPGHVDAESNTPAYQSLVQTLDAIDAEQAQALAELTEADRERRTALAAKTDRARRQFSELSGDALNQRRTALVAEQQGDQTDHRTWYRAQQWLVLDGYRDRRREALVAARNTARQLRPGSRSGLDPGQAKSAPVTEREAVPLSQDQQQVATTSRGGLRVPDTNTPLPSNETAEVPAGTLADIQITGISYRDGDHYRALPASVDQAPAASAERIIRTSRCTTPVRLAVAYAVSVTSAEPVEFSIVVSVNGRQVTTWTQQWSRSVPSTSRETTVELGVGEHVLSVVSDGENAVLESNENNNRLFARVVVEARPGTQLDCSTQARAATDAISDPRAAGRAADIGTGPATPSMPDDSVLTATLTQPDLVVSMADPMAPAVTISNRGHSPTTAAAELRLTCTADSGSCPADLVAEFASAVSVPPLEVDATYTHTIVAWPRTWDWPRGTYRFSATLNADRAVVESAANNTASATKHWDPTIPEIVERCMRCHIADNSGQGPSPDELAERELDKGFERMVAAAIGGVRRMPARGEIDWLTDAEVGSAVRHLIDLGDPTALAARNFDASGLNDRQGTIMDSKAGKAAAGAVPRPLPTDQPTAPAIPGDLSTQDTVSAGSRKGRTLPQPMASDTPNVQSSDHLAGSVPDATQVRGASELRQQGSSVYQRHLRDYNELLANIDKARREQERARLPSGSGYGVYGTDCDDTNPAVHPGAAELPCDTIDNDCDGQVNEGAPRQYLDADEDGWGDDTRPTVPHCAAIGYASRRGDCDDTNFAVHPGAVEIPGNQVDENCNGDLEN